LATFGASEFNRVNAACVCCGLLCDPECSPLLLDVASDADSRLHESDSPVSSQKRTEPITSGIGRGLEARDTWTEGAER
jgi:hypothetical protein